MKVYTPDQLERANKLSIVEYFQRNGYGCDKHRDETHIRGFGGFYVKNDNSYYIFSKQQGGKGLINCLMTVYDIPFRDAVKEALNGEEPSEEFSPTREQEKELKKSISYDDLLPHPPEKDPAPKEFIRPEKGKNNKRVYAYLCSRGISRDVINAMLRSGKLYQDDRGNAVFLHYNFSQPCGAEFHGTLSKCYYIGDRTSPKETAVSVEPYIAELLHQNDQGAFKFTGYVTDKEAIIYCAKQDIPLLDRRIEKYEKIPEEEKARIQKASRSQLKSFNGVAQGTSNTYFEYSVGADPTKKAYVFESAIDLMSFMTLHPEANDCSFVSMAGLKPSIIEDLMAKYDKIVLCVDNDAAGKEFLEKFSGRGLYRSPDCVNNGVKDFNDLLCKLYSVKKKSEHMASWAEQAVARTYERGIVNDRSKEER